MQPDLLSSLPASARAHHGASIARGLCGGLIVAAALPLFDRLGKASGAILLLFDGLGTPRVRHTRRSPDVFRKSYSFRSHGHGLWVRARKVAWFELPFIPVLGMYLLYSIVGRGIRART